MPSRKGIILAGGSGSRLHPATLYGGERNFPDILDGLDSLDYKPAHLPHIHVEYQGKEAVIGLPEGELLDGDLPVKKLKMVQA